MNDRQRIEACIIPALLYKVMKGLEDIQDTEEDRKTCNTIVQASLRASSEPLEDLMPDRARQVARRMAREFRAVISVMIGASNAQCLLAIYYLLEELLQEERLTIYEDSYFGEALNLYMSEIQYLFEKERLDAAAQKKAKQMRKILNRNGYFK